MLIREERKNNPNLNFLVRISSGGVRVFHVKGWGPKSSVCLSKPRESKLFGGSSWDFFAGISRGGPKRLRKIKVCVQLRAPTTLEKGSFHSKQLAGQCLCLTRMRARLKGGQIFLPGYPRGARKVRGIIVCVQFLAPYKI